MADVFSKHARTRQQQRSVSELAIDLLQRFGKEERHGACWRYSLDRKSEKRVRKYLGSLDIKNFERLQKSFVVVADDGVIVTCGYQTK